MLARKREQASKRRKRRDIDIINDNDDIIDQLIQNMRQAAEVNPDWPTEEQFHCIFITFSFSFHRMIVN